MDENPGSVEVGAYLLEVGGEGGTIVRQGGHGGKAKAEALRDALEGREPDAAEEAPALAGEIDEAAEATSKIEKAVALCNGAAEGHALDPDQLVLEVGSLLDCLERLDRKREHKKALQLARSLSTLLILLKRWASLVQTLRVALRAGSVLGDDSAVAWARHELGTLHLAAGDVGGADRELGQAREIRERIGDRRGLTATNRNMTALCERLRQMVREEELIRQGPGGRPPLRRALAAAAIAAALFVAGIVIGSLGGDSGSEPVAAEAAETGAREQDSKGDQSSNPSTVPLPDGSGETITEPVPDESTGSVETPEEEGREDRSVVPLLGKPVPSEEETEEEAPPPESSE